MKTSIGPARLTRRRPVRKVARKEKRSTRFKFDIVLGTGFRGHTVAVIVDGHDVYRRSGVTTNPETSQADAFVAVAERPHVHIAVCAIPGDVIGTAYCDLSAHRHVVIGLIGKATLTVETFARELAVAAAGLTRVRRA